MDFILVHCIFRRKPGSDERVKKWEVYISTGMHRNEREDKYLPEYDTQVQL